MKGLFFWPKICEFFLQTNKHKRVMPPKRRNTESLPERSASALFTAIENGEVRTNSTRLQAPVAVPTSTPSPTINLAEAYSDSPLQPRPRTKSSPPAPISNAKWAKAFFTVKDGKVWCNVPGCYRSFSLTSSSSTLCYHLGTHQKTPPHTKTVATSRVSIAEML